MGFNYLSQTQQEKNREFRGVVCAVWKFVGVQADKKCRTVVPNRSAEGQRTQVSSHLSKGRTRSSEPRCSPERLRTIVLQ